MTSIAVLDQTVADPEELHVLLVEDSAADANLIGMVLEQTGLPVCLRVVADGEDAIQFLANQGRFAEAPRPHLIILDLNVPRKDGFEVLADIRSNRRLRRIPVVILTSSANPSDIDEAYDRGANMYCKKPFELEKLERLITGLATVWLSLVCLPDGSAPRWQFPA